MSAPQTVTRRAHLRAAASLAMLATGGLAAAGCAAPLPGAGDASKSKQAVNLRLVWRATEAEYTFAQRIPYFQEKFPHVKVDVEYMPPDDYYTKLGVLFSSNTIGDVVFLEADDEAFYGFWTAQGMLNQLDPYIARDKYDMSVFVPNTVEALKIVDGKIWSFPYKAFMARNGLFYNASAFQQNGIPLPTDNWTYDDMRTAAQRLTKRSGSEITFWGGGRNFGGDFSFMAVTRAFGGDLYTPDGKRTLIGSEGSRQAISWWLDRYLKDQSIAVNPGVSNPRQLFEQGKAGFVGGYNVGDRRAIANALGPAGVQWGAVLMPKGPSGKRGGAFFLTPTGMPKITKHPDEAWEFQKMLAEKETGIVMGFPTALSGQTSAHFGVRKDVYTDPRVLNAPDMPPGVMATLARSMLENEPYYTAHNFLASDVEKVLNAEVAKAVRGEVQYDTGFFQNMANQIQLILDKPSAAGASIGGGR
jgi:ABC-type glycerol-3-phosphate transport system substrate-binding protein